MDVWGPARIRGQGHERYFLLVMDDYSRYPSVFPLRSKGEVTEVLIYWIRGACRQLSESFGSDLPVLRLHSDRGGEFSSDLLRAFYRAEGIRQTFTLLASPQQNGIAERRIGMVMDVARTSMIHAAAPHFLWPFAVQYAAHQINLQPRVSLPETTPTLRWTGKVGDPSVFRVWGSRAFVHNTSADKLSSRVVPFGVLLPSLSLPHCLSPPPPLFLAPGTPPIDPLEVLLVLELLGVLLVLEPLELLEVLLELLEVLLVLELVEVLLVLELLELLEVLLELLEVLLVLELLEVLLVLELLELLVVLVLLEVLEVLVLEPASPLAGPSPYSGPTRGLTERREPESHPVSPESHPVLPESRSASPVRTVCAGRVSSPRPPPVPGTHSMTLLPSTAPQRVPLPSPPTSSLPNGPDPESDSLRGARPAVMRFLATAVTDRLFESTAACALVAELVDFAVTCRLDYATSLVAESASSSVCPPSVGGECALGTDVLEDRQEEFECFAAAVPDLVSILLAPKADPDAPDIPTPRSYAEAIEGPYSSQWQAAMDAKMAYWKSTGTYAPREWHDTLRKTLDAHGFAPSTADPSLFLRTDTTLPPFYVLVYVDDLVFATADTEALAHVKSELQKRHMCTDLGELTSYLGLRITRDRAQRTISLTQSHMVQQVLQRFGFTYSSPQSTPLPTGHSLSAPPLDESVESSCPYPELVGYLMYLMTCTRPDLAYPLSLLARYVAPGRHRKVHWDAAKRVLRYLCSTSGMGLMLGGRARVVLTGHADASWVDNLSTQRSTQGYTFSLDSGSVSWRSSRSSSVLSSSCEAEIYAGAMATLELRWLTYLLTDLGEAPRSPPVLYVDNKAMLALC
ncbi:unnamed protein product [Closterium sp. NIES-54]